MKKEKKQNFVLSSSRSVSVRDIGRFFIPRTTTLRGDGKGVRGFTLIELLVVVLIIGILSAVALPQYQKAVMKTRFATMKPLVQHIVHAQQVYYLANNTYASTFEELGIEMGTGSGSHRTLPWGTCSVNTQYAFCKNTQLDMSYWGDYTGKRSCIVYTEADTSSARHRLCQAETGKSASQMIANSADSGGGSYVYP